GKIALIAAQPFKPHQIEDFRAIEQPLEARLKGRVGHDGGSLPSGILGPNVTRFGRLGNLRAAFCATDFCLRRPVSTTTHTSGSTETSRRPYKLHSLSAPPWTLARCTTATPKSFTSTNAGTRRSSAATSMD